MRYIKFRALRKPNPKTIELVRVTDNGKVVPKGYGPLLLEVLDNDVKTMGTSLKPTNILCFGATGSVDDIRITGTVDVYIDGQDQPLFMDVTEQQLAEFTKEDYQDLIQPYTQTVITPSSEFHFLMLDRPFQTNSNYNGMSLTLGIKVVGEDIRWISNGAYQYDPINGISTNELSYYDLEDASIMFGTWLADVTGFNIGVGLTGKKLIPSLEIISSFKHSQFMDVHYTSLLYSDETEVTNLDGYPVCFVATELSLTLPPEIEYVILPTLVTPYGQDNSYFKMHANNTMIYDNIVYYADGRIEKNVLDVPSLPDTNLYMQNDVFLLNYPEYVDGVVIPVDLSAVPVQMDQYSLTSGRYIDIKTPLTYARSLTLSYTTAEAPYVTQGVHWLDNNLGGRQLNASVVASKWDGAFRDTWYEYLTQTPEQTKMYLEPDIGRVYRFKLPADVLSVDICFNTN